MARPLATSKRAAIHAPPKPDVQRKVLDALVEVDLAGQERHIAVLARLDALERSIGQRFDEVLAELRGRPNGHAQVDPLAATMAAIPPHLQATRECFEGKPKP